MLGFHQFLLKVSVLEMVGFVEHNLVLMEKFEQIFKPDKLTALSTGDMFDTAPPTDPRNGSI
jgi:hypothetical protein